MKPHQLRRLCSAARARDSIASDCSIVSAADALRHVFSQVPIPTERPRRRPATHDRHELFDVQRPSPAWRRPATAAHAARADPQGRDAWHGWPRANQRARAWRTVPATPGTAAAGRPLARADPRPRKNIVCLGLNYASHVKESAQAREREVKIPEAPVFFTKAPTTVNGPYDPMPWDRAVTAAGGLRSGARRHHRRAAARTSRAPSALDARVRLHGHQRRVRARSADAATCSGSRARASTASARWVRSS